MVRPKERSLIKRHELTIIKNKSMNQYIVHSGSVNGFKNLSKLLFFISAAFLLSNCSVKDIKEEDVKDNGVQLISAKNVFNIISDTLKVNDYIILDLRERMDYIRGHIQPAVWVTIDSLEEHLDNLSKEVPIVVYDSTGVISLKAAKLLMRNGFKKVMVLDGGINDWQNNAYPLAIQLVINKDSKLDIERKIITMEKVYDIIKKSDVTYVLIDLRPAQDYRDGYITGAISIPYVPLNEFVVSIEEHEFTKNRKLVVYADNATSVIGENACDVLLRNEYTEVYLIKEGYEGWFSKDYPLSTAY
jgi:rhodanese-related sulfurtransferase